MEDVYVHPTAVLDQPCTIGPGSRIWHFCHVMAGAHIGPGCVLGQGVFVGADVRLGAGCHIQNHVSLFTGVELGERVFVGPAVAFTNVRTPRVGQQRNTPAGRSPIRVDHDASIGANATLIAGVTIGPWALVAAGAVVTRPVAAHALVVGNPARRRGWVCRCATPLVQAGSGLRCPECAAGYRLEGGRLRFDGG